MTKMLFLDDCYLKEFDATVLSVSDSDKGPGLRIELDQSAFYPESGGQPTDLGKLIKVDSGDEFVITRVAKADDKIFHFVDKPGLEPGDKVHGIIDWERRYLFTRYHTACHILATIVHETTGAHITGNQIASDKARVDFDLENFDRSLIASFEEKANALIADSRPVAILFLSREEAFQIPSLVKLKMALPEHIGTIRIIDIQGFDQQACAGTHVKNTFEVGKIAIQKAENKGKSNRRIYFVLE